MEAAIASSDAQEFVRLLTTYISNTDSNTVIIDDDNKDSGVDTTTIEKLHQLKDLLQKSITIITKNCNDIIKAAATKASSSSSSSSSSGEAETFLVIEEAQFVEPRGKFKATINKGGLFLEGKQGNLFINWSNFARSACIPSSSSSKKEGEDILVFVLSEPVKLNNKDISNFQWILNKSDKKVVNITFDSNNVSGTEAAIIPKLVRRLTDKSVDIPRPAIFSSKTKDRPYLLCHKGIQEGAVYPMKSGVIFVKPLLYIPFNEIASVSAGRGGTQVTTRYVDLIIETADERQYEFTNIERDDLPALNGYVKNYLEERIRHENAMIKEQEIAENDGEGDDDDDDEDDEDSEDDEDFHPDGDFDDDGSGSDDDSKNDSNNETEDEDVISKENAKPQKDLKESRKSKNPKKKVATKGKKEIDPRKSKSPQKQKQKTDIFPKSVLGFVSLVEDEINTTGKRGPSSEIDLVNENVKEQKLM